MRVYGSTTPDLGAFYPTLEWLEFVRGMTVRDDATYVVGYVESSDYFVFGDDEFGLVLKSTSADLVDGVDIQANLPIESELLDGFVGMATLEGFAQSATATRYTSTSTAKEVDRTIEQRASGGNPIVVVGDTGSNTEMLAVNVGGDSGLPPTRLRDLATDWFAVGTSTDPVWFVGLATSPEVVLADTNGESCWEGGTNCLGATVCPMVGSTDVQFITYDENSIIGGAGNPLLLADTTTDLYLSRFQNGTFDTTWIEGNSITDIAVTLTTNKPWLSVGIAPYVSFDLPPEAGYDHVFLYRATDEGGFVAFIAEMPEPENKAGFGWVGIDVGASVLII